MKKAIRTYFKDFIALVILIVVAMALLGYILSQQKAAIPGWIPFFGQNFYELNAEFSTGQAVTAGQGQGVDIAGVRIGKIGAIKLQDGVAVVRMDIDPKYAELIHPNATLLLRPKTGLNDMVVQVDVGSGDKTIPEGSTIPLSQTEPNVQPDQFLNSLDADTRDYLTMLLQGGAQALGGEGQAKTFSSVLRRFAPTARDLGKINGLLSRRRENVKRSIHSFSLIAQQLGENDGDVANFVTSSNRALKSFASQQASIRQTLQELPATLEATQAGLEKSDRLSQTMRPALIALLPGAKALQPALEATQGLFTATTVPIRDQIRPFTKQVKPTLTSLSQASGPLAKTTKGLRGAFSDLNQIVNLLAYNPSGSEEGYLFWLSWMNHNLNSMYLIQDSEGPLRRNVLLLSCSTLSVGESTGLGLPLLQTQMDTTGIPTSTQVCPVTPP